MPRDPENAYAWLRESGDPDTLGEYLAKAIHQWARSDFNAAGEWLGKLPPSAEKDAAVLKFVETVVGIDSEAAAAWVDEIGDEELRKTALDQALERSE